MAYVQVRRQIVPFFNPQNVKELKEIRKKTLEEISDDCWLPDERMADFLADEYFKLYPRSSKTSDTIQGFFALIEAIEEKKDEYSAADISEVLDLKPTYIQTVLNKIRLGLMHSNETMKQAIEWGIQNGAILEDIAKKADCSYQNIGLYFKVRPEMKKRLEKSQNQRKELDHQLAKGKPKAIKKLISLVMQNIKVKHPHNFALVKATEYTQKAKNTPYKFTTLVEFFERYKKEDGLTLKQLGKPHGFSPLSTMRILKNMDYGQSFALIMKD